jgi:hypothetical protein
MPKTLKELPKVTRKGAGGGRGEMYPYDTWLTGQPIELVQGTKEEVEKGKADYTAKTATILNVVRKAAERRGLNIKSVTTDGGVAIQSVPLSEMPKRVRKSKNGDAPA